MTKVIHPVLAVENRLFRATSTSMHRCYRRMNTGSIREKNWQAACDALHIFVGHDCFGVEAAVALERHFKEALKAELTTDLVGVGF